jgi:osmotically-inducible protein OsmY
MRQPLIRRPALRQPALQCLLLLSLLLAPACSPLGVATTAGAVVGSAALQERGFQRTLDDKSMEVSIQKALIAVDFETFQRIDVSVVEGRILMTGIVPNADDRVKATQIAWQSDGVVEVINEVLIGNDVGFINSGFDLKIEKALDLDLTLDKEIKGVNYIPDSMNGTLFIIGIAQNQAELDRVLAHARNVERVRRVVSYVQLKGSPERKAVLKKLEEMDAQKAAE